eukprot:g3985.t1
MESKSAFSSTAADSDVTVLPSKSESFRAIELTRPKKLNSLSLDMIKDLSAAYNEYLAAGSKVRCILLKGEGRAFCAGGDVAAVRSEAIRGGPDVSLPQQFFYQEYKLNSLIANMFQRNGVSQVSLWDGITMGGGVGLSVHGKFRVATENTLFAKPETGIGLFPDVGGTHVLGQQVNGGVAQGLYIGLTGARLKAADLLYSGLATHYVPSDRLSALEAALESLGERVSDCNEVEAAIREAGGGAVPDTEKAVLEKHNAVIQSCFSQPTAEGIAAKLAETAEQGSGEDAEFAGKTLKILKKMSPTSVKVTIEGVKRSSDSSVTVNDALEMEYRLSQRFVLRPQPDSDFAEGIRAVLIDKDGKPNWNPATFEDVSDAHVEGFFAPLESSHLLGELKLSSKL